MRIATVAALVTAATMHVPIAAQSSADRDAILKTVQAFFDTMTAKDVEGARKILMPQGRFHATRIRDGNIRSFTNEEYFADLQASKQTLRERMWNPEVRVRGLIATVWTPYDFWIDGNYSHCGIDAFDLVKTDEGWKIAGGAYTLEEKCEPSPLGPPKAQM